MSKLAAIVIFTGLAMLSPVAHGADYNCAKPETTEALKKADSNIADREAAIAEMKGEIKETGGSTEEQKKALQGFEDKLAKAKEDRAKLASECSEKS